MAMSAQSRLTVLDNPVLAPGICSLCGSAGGDDRKFIDFGKQLEWYGAVYFCSFCIREAAEAIDYIPVANFDELHKEFRELRIKFDQLEAKNKSVEDALRVLLGDGNSLSVDNNDAVRDVLPPMEESPTNVSAIEDSADGNSKAEQSTSVEGSDDLFDASDYE